MQERELSIQQEYSQKNSPESRRLAQWRNMSHEEDYPRDKAKRGVRFEVEEPLMFSNNKTDKGGYYDKEKENKKKEERQRREWHRITEENRKLKSKLQRKWSSRSSGSFNADVFTETDEDDETLLMLRDNTTLHGLRDIMTTHSTFRAIWIVILGIAIGFSLHGVYQIYQEYSLRRVVVSYFLQESPSLSIPDIVICPFNRFNRSYLEHWNVSSGLAQYLELSYPSPVIHSFQGRTYEETLQNIDQYEYELEILLEKVGNMSYTQFLKEASLGCEAFFKEPHRCVNLTEIMTSAGKCFRINGPDQTASGFGYGERVIISLPKQLYHAGSNQMLNDGIALKLATRGKGIDNDLTFIPAGVHAIIPLTATRYEFMNDPPRYECEMDPDGTYSRVWCYEDCLTSEAEDICNCSLAAATRPRKPNICTTKQFYHCFAPHLFHEHEQLQNMCKAKCKTPCTYWHYQKSVSYATFPSQTARYFVANQSEWEELHSTIVLEIYFTVLDFIMIKHVVAMPLQSVIAQIGGQFSLWAGASLISFCQLLVYGLQWCCKRTNRCIRRRKSSKIRHLRAKRREEMENGHGPKVEQNESSVETKEPTDSNI